MCLFRNENILFWSAPSENSWTVHPIDGKLHDFVTVNEQWQERKVASQRWHSPIEGNVTASGPPRETNLHHRMIVRKRRRRRRRQWWRDCLPFTHWCDKWQNWTRAAFRNCDVQSGSWSVIGKVVKTTSLSAALRSPAPVPVSRFSSREKIRQPLIQKLAKKARHQIVDWGQGRKSLKWRRPWIAPRRCWNSEQFRPWEDQMKSKREFSRFFKTFFIKCQSIPKAENTNLWITFKYKYVKIICISIQ